MDRTSPPAPTGRCPRVILMASGTGALSLLLFFFPPLPVGFLRLLTSPPPFLLSLYFESEIKSNLLNYISTFTTLQPGDVIVTGTPTGAGARFDPPIWLKPGDEIVVEAEGIGQLQWRKLCGQAVALLRRQPPEDLLAGVDDDGFTLADAIAYLHAPPAGAALDALQDGRHPAQLRLAREELLAHHLSLRHLRARERAHRAPAMAPDSAGLRDFLARLPFAPTGAQERVMAEIADDLAGEAPMLRLVQGDVGSGKTLVAAAAARQAIAAGYQVAIMAPTELLAEQHRVNFEGWFAEEPVTIAWLSGRVKGAARREALAAIGDGSADLVVGTHALFQDAVSFARLGLLIVDEQHRFGVHQRLSLKGKAAEWRPHQLVMTATPIPRTLSMVAYADLDCSVIDELPPGRKPVNTVLVDSARRDTVIERVARACAEGRQAYWVCTLVEESDVLQAQAAEATYEELAEGLPGLRVGLIHGKLPAARKAEVMAAFKAGDCDLLVATTVIEVGVNVPNASVMVIESAERFGLSQLHQLRGRVGRGEHQSYCFFIGAERLSEVALERLKIMEKTSNGFDIAEADLKIRGPGEFLGTRQSGSLPFKVADIIRDQNWLLKARDDATDILKNDPTFERISHLPLRNYFQNDGKEKLHQLMTS